jgi:phage host-nuclease inhibitor protein Gam
VDELTFEAEDDLFGDLMGEEPDYESEPGAPANAEQVNGTMRRLWRIEREAKQTAAAFNDELARITAMRDERLAVLDKQKTWLQSSVVSYFQAIHRENTKAPKTLHLPYGTLTVRRGSLTHVFEDEEATLAWAIENDVDAVKQVLDKAAVRTLFPAAEVKGAEDPWEDEDRPVLTAEGEPIPGVHAVRKAKKFDVKSPD